MKRYEQVYRIPLIILKIADESTDEKEPLEPKLFRPSSHRKSFLLTKIWKSCHKTFLLTKSLLKATILNLPFRWRSINSNWIWWKLMEGFGGRRQFQTNSYLCYENIFPFHIFIFIFSIFCMLSVEYFCCLCILRQLLLMADRPQPISLSTQIITEICTYTQGTAWSIHAT